MTGPQDDQRAAARREQPPPGQRMTPAERGDTFVRALAPALRILADPDSPPQSAQRAREALRKITALIDALHGFGEHQDPETAHPMSRAHARESPLLILAVDDGNDARREAGLNGLRQGRDQCTAHRRDGEPCQAPAIPGGLVCRRHGGAAPQVAIKARHLELQAAAAAASEAFKAARGTPGEFDALCAASRANRELDEYEAKMELLRELRARARARAKGDGAA